MKFACLHCGQRYEIEDRFAGQSTHCQTCGNMMKIPVPIGDEVVPVQEVVQLSSDLLEGRIRRRRKRKWLRRILLVLLSLLLGIMLGAIAVIVVETLNPKMHWYLIGETEEVEEITPPAPAP